MGGVRPERGDFGFGLGYGLGFELGSGLHFSVGAAAMGRNGVFGRSADLRCVDLRRLVLRLGSRIGSRKGLRSGLCSRLGLGAWCGEVGRGGGGVGGVRGSVRGSVFQSKVVPSFGMTVRRATTVVVLP